MNSSPRRMFTEQEKARARKLAYRMRAHIEEHFSEPYNPVTGAELKAMRRELEEMGFVVQYVCELDTQTRKINAEVTLLVPKQIH
jgi:hypothetical protein